MGMKTVPERRQEKLAQIEKLNKEIAGLTEKEAGRLGKLAVKAGLAELAVSDKDMLAALKEVAARFQNGKAKQAS